MGVPPKSSIFLWDFPFWGTPTSGNHQDDRHVRQGLPVPQVPPQGLHGARQHGGALR